MTQLASSGPSALDTDALSRLAHAVGDISFPPRFAALYRALLPDRVTRIARSLVGHDLDAALDAILSLKVSSMTVGTQELAALACLIEGEVRVFDLPAARTAAGFLTAATDRADAALAAYLDV